MPSANILRGQAYRARAAAANKDSDGIRYLKIAEVRTPAAGMWVGATATDAKAYAKAFNMKELATIRVKESRPSVHDTECVREHCPYRLVIRYRGTKRANHTSEEGEVADDYHTPGGMYVTKFQAHTPQCGIGITKKPKVSNVALHAKDLGNILVPHVQANPRMITKAALAALEGHYTQIPSLKKIQLGLQWAKEQVNGNRTSTPRLLLQAKAELEMKGHTLNIITGSRQEQLTVLKDLRDAAAAAVVPRDTAILDEAIQHVTALHSDSTFLVGYVFVPEHGPRMFDTLRPCLAADAAHMKLKEDTGTVFGVWAQDANKHMICLSLMVVFDTENKRTWDRMLQTIKTHYPSLDVAGTAAAIIADGDKGLKSAFDERMQHCKLFLCAHHKAGGVKKAKGVNKPEDVDLFWKAVKATTLGKLEDILSRMSQPAQEYLRATDSSQLYLVHMDGKTGGKSSSQLAETGNSVLERMREQQLGVGLLQFLGEEMSRLEGIAVKVRGADHTTDALPPNLRKDLDDRVTYNNARGWNLTVAFGGDDSAATVTSRDDPTKSYTLFLHKPHGCSCGSSRVLAKPCKHEIFAARTANVDPASLYSPFDQVAAWKRTYEAMGELAHVATNLVYDRVINAADVPLMPLKTKPQKGRPKGPMDRHRPAREAARTDNLLRNRLAIATRVTRSASQAAAAQLNRST